MKTRRDGSEPLPETPVSAGEARVWAARGARQLGRDPQAQAAAAEDFGPAARPRAPLRPSRPQRSGVSPGFPSPGGAPRECSVRGAGGWGGLPAGRQPPLGLLQPLFPVFAGSGDRAARCFCSSPFPLPEGSLLLFPSPAPACFSCGLKTKRCVFELSHLAPAPAAGPRCAAGRRHRRAPARASRRPFRRRCGVLCFGLKAFPRGEASLCACLPVCVLDP